MDNRESMYSPFNHAFSLTQATFQEKRFGIKKKKMGFGIKHKLSLKLQFKQALCHL